jgi:hypothetical protein
MIEPAFRFFLRFRIESPTLIHGEAMRSGHAGRMLHVDYGSPAPDGKPADASPADSRGAAAFATG